MKRVGLNHIITKHSKERGFAMNTQCRYKYNPDDFCNILGMSEDLSNFYKSLEIYRENENDDTWFPLRNRWEDLFFTIKHRAVEGALHPVTAQDIRSYLEVLVND